MNPSSPQTRPAVPFVYSRPYSWMVSPDHLDSTSPHPPHHANGQLHSETKYMPWRNQFRLGEPRLVNGHCPTEIGYTGQREVVGIGLYFYNARHYDPALGTFVQADTIIPQLNMPQDWDRYKYVRNNPMLFTDSSGHCLDGLSTVICIAMAIAMSALLSGSTSPVANTPTSTQTIEKFAQDFSDVDALVTSFTTDQLSGATPDKRLETVLAATEKLPYQQFGVNFGSNTSFGVEFQDGTGTGQAGHFLTAVGLGYSFAGTVGESAAVNFIVGHEMVGDIYAPSGVLQNTNHLRQYFAAAGTEAGAWFLNAVEADLNGYAGLRDDYLQMILDLGDNGVGNSMADLRLSVRGWIFGQSIASGQITTNQQAADWLEQELR